jgi:hypothetical protein
VESSRFASIARRIATALAIGALGVGAAGCGGDDDGPQNPVDDAVEQATEADQQIESIEQQAQQRLEEAQQQLEEQSGE